MCVNDMAHFYWTIGLISWLTWPIRDTGLHSPAKAACWTANAACHTFILMAGGSHLKPPPGTGTHHLRLTANNKAQSQSYKKFAVMLKYGHGNYKLMLVNIILIIVTTTSVIISTEHFPLKYEIRLKHVGLGQRWFCLLSPGKVAPWRYLCICSHYLTCESCLQLASNFLMIQRKWLLTKSDGKIILLLRANCSHFSSGCVVLQLWSISVDVFQDPCLGLTLPALL